MRAVGEMTADGWTAAPQVTPRAVHDAAQRKAELVVPEREDDVAVEGGQLGEAADDLRAFQLLAVPLGIVVDHEELSARIHRAPRLEDHAPLAACADDDVPSSRSPMIPRFHAVLRRRVTA